MIWYPMERKENNLLSQYAPEHKKTGPALMLSLSFCFTAKFPSKSPGYFFSIAKPGMLILVMAVSVAMVTM
jgi:hypothetical protein